MELMNIASGKMRKDTKPGLVISTQCGVSHKVSLLFGLPRWLFPWKRKWQPTPVFLPWKSHGQRNLAGYSPWLFKD